MPRLRQPPLVLASTPPSDASFCLLLSAGDARAYVLPLRINLSADRELTLREFLVTHLLIRPRQRVVSFHIVRLQFQSAPQLSLRRCDLLLCEQRASHAVMRLEPFRLQADSLAIEIFRRFKLPPLKFNVARQPVGIVKVRVELDLLLELVQGRLLIPLALVRVSQMVMSERKLWAKGEGLFELLEGGNGAVQVVVGAPEQEVRFGVVGVEAKKSLKRTDRARVLLLAQIHQCQIVVVLGNAGAEFDGAAKRRPGVFVQALLEQRDAQELVKRRGIRVLADREARLVEGGIDLTSFDLAADSILDRLLRDLPVCLNYSEPGSQDQSRDEQNHPI